MYFAVMKARRRQKVKEVYMQTLQDIYKENTATIKLHKVSDVIPKTEKVRQGDITSLKVFTTVLKEVYKNFERDKAEIMNLEYLNNLRFVDDIVLIISCTYCSFISMFFKKEVRAQSKASFFSVLHKKTK